MKIPFTSNINLNIQVVIIFSTIHIIDFEYVSGFYQVFLIFIFQFLISYLINSEFFDINYFIFRSIHFPSFLITILVI